MNIVEKLSSLRPTPLPRGRELEDPAGYGWKRKSKWVAGSPVRRQDVATTETTRIVCPRCNSRVALDPLTCDVCGFPFICDVTPVDRVQQARRTASWRTILGIAALVFALSNAVFVAAGSEQYAGTTTNVISALAYDASSGIPINGPDIFVGRTQLTLDLLKERAPDYYFRLRQGVASIDLITEEMVNPDNGKHVSLEGIGALSNPDTGRVQVMYGTAFPSGVDELTDGDVFTYAGVLVHELRHIELHHAGEAPGGWQEEVLCEQAAYGAEQAMQAPGSILARYEMYLRDPTAERYQGWYDWYKQFK